MTSNDSSTLKVDVISDVVCPWCFIGRRRLGAALAQMAERAPKIQPVVKWYPFELNPDLTRQGISRQVYLETKFGGRARSTEIYRRVAHVGIAVGIDFAFDRIERQPNTLDAHRLIAWSQPQGRVEDLVERLFRAYFLEGRFIGDRAVLAAIAGEAGLSVEDARNYLVSDQGIAEIKATESRVRELGVDGVPFFVFGGKIGVAGAQEASVLVDAMVEAIKT